MTVYYGRRVLAHEADLALAGSGTMRACRYDIADEHLWVRQLGFWGGRNGVTTPTVRLGLYNAASGITTRVGYCDAISASTQDNGGPNFGTSYQADMDVVDDGSALAAKIYSGQRYAIAILSTGATLGISMLQASMIVEDDEQFYTRFSLSQPPPNPFGSSSASTEGHMSLWAVCEPNDPPGRVAHADMSPSGSVIQIAPTFTFPFKDVNAGDYSGIDVGDTPSRLKIQLRRKSDQVAFWTYDQPTNGSEQAAGAISRAYLGTTLVRGTEYEWRCQVYDDFDEASLWSDDEGAGWLSFTPAELGFITLDSDPTGKIESVTPDFKGRWHHELGQNMTHVRVRLLNAAGNTVLQTGSLYNIADVASSASPGTLFTIPWASTGFTSLAWGTSYQYQMQGTDASAELSDWSNLRPFNTNAAPTVPSGLVPVTGFVTTVRPLLQVTASDADDTTGTGFVVKARIKNSGGTVLQTRSMIFNSGNGKWEYQTVSGDLASFATYRWDAYSGDGTLWSGEVAWGSEASAVKSAENVFTYASGPQVVIDAPAAAAVLTSASVLVDWHLSGGGPQAQFRVRLLDTATQAVLYLKDWTVSTTEQWTIPAGSYLNGAAMTVEVGVRDSILLEGFATVSVTVDYPPADDVLNVTAVVEGYGFDSTDNSIRLSWDQTAYGGEWGNYQIHRSASGGPDAAEVLWATITSPSEISIVDHYPASGYTYYYRVTQSINVGVEFLSSDGVTVSAEIAMEGVSLVQVTNPSVRTAFNYLRSRSYKPVRDDYLFVPESTSKPTTIRAASQYWEVDITAELHGDSFASFDQRFAEANEILESTALFVYRDELKKKYVIALLGEPVETQAIEWALVNFIGRENKYAGVV